MAKRERKTTDKKAKAKPKVVALAGYKDALARRKRAELRKSLAVLAKHCGTRADLAGFVLMAIGADGETETFYDCGSIPATLLPAFVADRVKAAQIAAMEAEQVS